LEKIAGLCRIKYVGKVQNLVPNGDDGRTTKRQSA
jgi:hypothetical protein